MWYILIFICFFLTHLNSSIPIPTNEYHHNRQIRLHRSSQSRGYNNEIVDFNISSITEDQSSSSICSAQSINIDTTTIEVDHAHKTLRGTSATVSSVDIIQFTSSWENTVVTDDDFDSSEDEDAHSTPLHMIQIIFTIPYVISNNSILNKTVLITDVTHNQLLASLTDICINVSSFIIHYSTIRPLPHNVCLYLLLNLTSSTSLKEIIFCRTIDDSVNDTSSWDDSATDDSHGAGPSQFFILSQCVIILIMMFIIFGVQTARQKNLANRVSQRVFRSRPYITIFGSKAAVRTSSTAIDRASIHPATTLQTGLNQFVYQRNLAALSNNQSITSIDEEVLAANDLTSTINDRRATRPSISRDLINIKEFTKRMSASNEHTSDTESYDL